MIRGGVGKKEDKAKYKATVKSGAKVTAKFLFQIASALAPLEPRIRRLGSTARGLWLGNNEMEGEERKRGSGNKESGVGLSMTCKRRVLFFFFRETKRRRRKGGLVAPCR